MVQPGQQVFIYDNLVTLTATFIREESPAWILVEHESGRQEEVFHAKVFPDQETLLKQMKKDLTHLEWKIEQIKKENCDVY